MKYFAIALLIVVTAAATVFTYRYVEQNTDWVKRWEGETHDEEQVAEAPQVDRKIHALGHLEPAGGVVTISALPGERLQKLHVREGQEVTFDQDLARLASHRLRAKEVEALKKQLDAAKAEIVAKKNVANANVQQATSALNQAKHKEKELETETKKVELLQRKHEQSMVSLKKMEEVGQQDPELFSAAEIEQRRLLVRKDELEYEQAKLLLELGPKLVELAIKAAEANLAAATAAKEQLDSGTAVAALDARLAVARIQKSWSTVRSPLPQKAVVLDIMMNEGEVVTRSPIMQIADTSSMVCRAEVYESDAKRIEKGATCTIRSPAFKEPFDKQGLPGKVQRVGRSISAAGMQSLNPLAPTAKHVVEVVIEVDPQDKPAVTEAARLIDLQVEVSFDSSSSKSSSSKSQADEVAKSGP